MGFGHNQDRGGAAMGRGIARDVDEMEHETAMRCSEVPVKKAARKCVYLLPSGRKMTVILDDEARPIPAVAWLPGTNRIGC
jgi:hypothetical protein